MCENVNWDNSLGCLMPALLGRFPDRHGRVPMVLAVVAGVDSIERFSRAAQPAYLTQKLVYL
jgi:hypothetical protein